jgi:hypothetical protein
MYKLYKTKKILMLQNKKIKIIGKWQAPALAGPALVLAVPTALNKSKSHQKSKDEHMNLKEIHEHLAHSTPSGIKIKNAFSNAFPQTPIFDKSVESGGNRSTHYDFILNWDNEASNPVSKTVEFKGNKEKFNINNQKRPWTYGVQFFNGPGNKFSIGRKYAQQFYETMLDKIINEKNIQTPKPSYEVWAADAFRQSKPQTPFVCELREKLYKSTYLSDIRREFNKNFTITKEDEDLLKNEVYEVANKVLREKDYWLHIAGTMDNPDNFEVNWYGNVIMSQIEKIEKVVSKNSSDMNFMITCEDGTTYNAKMRWGYGQCITNIRIDLK